MNKRKRLNTSQIRDLLVASRGITREEADNIIKTILEAIKSNLKAGNDVVLDGVCVLASKTVKPHTKKGFGLTYEVGERKKLSCRASVNLFNKPETTKTDDNSDIIENFSKGLEKLKTDLL